MSRPQDRARATVPAPRSSSPRPAPDSDVTLGQGARITAYVLLTVAGVAVGLAGCFVQALWFPGGLLLALGAAFALFHGGRTLTGTRLGAALPAVGWFAMLLLANTQRPEGDFLLAANTGSYVFLLGGMALAVICATLPSRAAMRAVRDAVGR
ncbi:MULTISPECIES: DUF6113 family protein [Streptacidiphilus]|uniref:DUF6113 family protein n=1 Tax=Streptacidiphilus cavernicola TaxID=3342716 RepID=A0ABV6UHG8_9ACTN|nr:DUF6113 family protein [Streptacidiphilus jeojiense]